jgi:hypothetical protein
MVISGRGLFLQTFRIPAIPGGRERGDSLGARYLLGIMNPRQVRGQMFPANIKMISDP